MPKIVLFVLFFLLFATFTSAATTKGGYFGCRTNHDHDRLVEKILSGNKNFIYAMVKTGRCFVLKAGIDVTIYKTENRITLVEAHSEGKDLVLWTFTEGLNL